MAKKINVFTDGDGNIWIGRALKNGEPSVDSRKLEENEIQQMIAL